MAPLIICFISPSWLRQFTSNINLFTLTRVRMWSIPIPPTCSCAYSTSSFICFGYLNFFFITACIFCWITCSCLSPMFPNVVGYSICLTTTACSTCITPPIVMLRTLNAAMLLFTFAKMFSCLLPSYMTIGSVGVWPLAFCTLPKCLK